MSVAGIADLGAFVAGCVAITLLPGPNSLFVMTASVSGGRTRGWAASAGVVAADTVFIVAAALGVAALLHAQPRVFDALRWAGGAYLAWLGLRLLAQGVREWRERRCGSSSAPVPAVGKTSSHASTPDASASRARASRPDGTTEAPRAAFWRALAIGLLNPKAIMFYVAFFPQFASPGESDWRTFVAMGLIQQAISLVYLTLLVIGGARIAEAARKSAWLSALGSTATGLLFIGFGAKLAAARTVQ